VLRKFHTEEKTPPVEEEEGGAGVVLQIREEGRKRKTRVII